MKLVELCNNNNFGKVFINELSFIDLINLSYTSKIFKEKLKFIQAEFNLYVENKLSIPSYKSLIEILKKCKGYIIGSIIFQAIYKNESKKSDIVILIPISSYNYENINKCEMCKFLLNQGYFTLFDQILGGVRNDQIMCQ